MNTETQAAGQGDEMITKKELAARLKVTVRTIERWQHDGHLPYFKVASVVLFNWPEVVAHLHAKYRVQSQAQSAKRGAGSREPKAEIGDRKR